VDRVENGYEFVEKRLSEADSPMSPDELAKEYGCGNQYTQNICSELAQKGVIERVGEGQYVMADESEESETDSYVTAEPEATTKASEEGEEDPSGGGGAQSGGPDTGDEDSLSGRDTALVGGATAGAAAVPSALEKMSTRQTVALSVSLLVVLYLLTRDGSDSSSDAVDDDQEESGDEFEHAGGLV